MRCLKFIRKTLFIGKEIVSLVFLNSVVMFYFLFRIIRDLSIHNFMLERVSAKKPVVKLVSLSSVILLPTSSDFQSFYEKNPVLLTSLEICPDSNHNVNYSWYHSDPDFLAPEYHSHLEMAKDSNNSAAMGCFSPDSRSSRQTVSETMNRPPMMFVSYQKSMDLWSLGMIFLFLCTGKVLTFQDKQPWETQINNSLPESVPKKLKAFILRLLQVNPESRPTIEEMQTSLPNLFS
jgi:serine/threonine protein kinase